MSARTYLTAVAGGLLALAGCSQQGQGDEPMAARSEPANGTVAATVASSSEHRKLAAALTDTQLAPVLDGKGIYTLLAPRDAAFAALGAKGEALAGPDRRPLMIAVLRAHLLPGQLTPEAIQQAIARKRGPVEMRTMAGGTVRFSKTGNGIEVTNGEIIATLDEVSQSASNGAVLPIDKVLLPGGD